MRKFSSLGFVVAALLSASAVSAQTFPDKPITFIVSFGAGTATDQIARAIASGVSAETKQSVVVDNRAGANGFIASRLVAQSPADGYTVLITTNSTHVVNQFLFKSVPYDSVKDFEPITALGKGGQYMVVNASSPAKSLGEFIAMAKKEPGKYTSGSGSSQSRVGAELMQQMAGIKLLAVPYKTNTLALNELMAGQIDTMMVDTTIGTPLVKAGRIRALGFTTDKRSALAPEVPTLAEAGLKGYEMGYWFAAYAPAKTPPAVVKRLNELLVKAARSDAAKAAFYQPTGTDVFTGSPTDLAKFQQEETEKWRGVVKAAGIEPE